MVWQDITVGEIVRLKNMEPIPVRVRLTHLNIIITQVDMIVLSNSSPDGDCFIETADLDGYVTSSHQSITHSHFQRN